MKKKSEPSRANTKPEERDDPSEKLRKENEKLYERLVREQEKA